MRVYILCPTGQRMMFHMLMLLEADSGERGAEIAPLSSVFQISLSLLSILFISGLVPHFLSEVVPIISYSPWRVSFILCVCLCVHVRVYVVT